MKKLSLLVVGIVGLTAVLGRAQANYTDSEALAQASLFHTVDHYSVTLQSSTSLGATWQNTIIQAMLDQNLTVTNLSVNSTNIPLSKPLSGLPIPADGLQNVTVDVAAIDKNGVQGSHGRMSTNYLMAQTPISVTMTPKFPKTAIQLPAGLDQNKINVQVSGVNGWGWSYDPVTGLLTIDTSWGDVPTGIVVYTVTDSDGGKLAQGTLPFFLGSSGGNADPNSVLNLHNAGEYMAMLLGTNGYNYVNGLAYDSSVVRDGTNVAAKVITVPDIANQSKLYVYVSSQDDVTIEVRKWSATGQMQLVQTTPLYSGSGYQAVTTPYLDKAVITVIPKNPSSNDSLYVDISRWY